MNLGIAFQLVDDALDYGGASTALGKNVGDDFREGKVTLPSCSRSGAATRRSAASGAARWRVATSPSATWSAQSGSCGGIARSRTRSSARATTARWHADALALFPKSPMKTALLGAVDFCIARVN
jgi:octaprenyl-diphosphate synthase